MAKLKFDRNIKISLGKDDRVDVPKDEIWKGTLICGDVSSIEFKTIAYETFTYGISPNSIIGGGTTLKGLVFTGIVFKVV